MTEPAPLTQKTTLLKENESKPVHRTLFNPILWTFGISIVLYIIGFAFAFRAGGTRVSPFLFWSLRYAPLAVLVASSILSTIALVRKDKKAEILSIVVLLVLLLFVIV